METSLMQIVGPFFIIMGFGVLINFKYTMKMMQEVLDSRAIGFVMAIVSLLFGLLIVTYVSYDGASLPVMIIYILGCLGLLKGIVWMLFPKHLKKHAQKWMKNEMWMKGWVFLVTLFGLWITWVAYF